MSRYIFNLFHWNLKSYFLHLLFLDFVKKSINNLSNSFMISRFFLNHVSSNTNFLFARWTDPIFLTPWYEVILPFQIALKKLLKLFFLQVWWKLVCLYIVDDSVKCFWKAIWQDVSRAIKMFTSFVNIISPLGVYPKEIIQKKGNTI